MGGAHTSSSREQCNVVQCVIDKHDATTLTLRCHNAWFYITAAPTDIENDNVCSRYKELVKAARLRQEDVERVQSGQTRIYDQHEHDAGERDLSSKDKSRKDNARDHNSREEQHRDDDSGYGSKALSRDGSEAEEEQDDEEKLHAWLQLPLKQIFTKTKDRTQQDTPLTLSEWYNTDIHFYRLKCGKDQEQAEVEPRDDLDGPSYVRDTLTPKMKMPKYITDLADLKWFSPDEMHVMAESHDIHLPIHPTLIRVPASKGSEETSCFLKLASLGDERAVKREIKFLHELAKRDLYQHGIVAPKLVGLVSPPSEPESRNHVLGFMISLIPQPTTPLTKMMTTKVDQSERDRWATDAENMVATLHKHDLTWGDAKADNFLVDKDQRLWIIDFGGSYTPGWIDEQLADSQEGDDMGVGKTSNGLRDPVNGTYGDEDEYSAEGAAPGNETYVEKSTGNSPENRAIKRKRDDDDTRPESKQKR